MSDQNREAWESELPTEPGWYCWRPGDKNRYPAKWMGGEWSGPVNSEDSNGAATCEKNQQKAATNTTGQPAGDE